MALEKNTLKVRKASSPMFLKTCRVLMRLSNLTLENRAHCISPAKCTQTAYITLCYNRSSFVELLFLHIILMITNNLFKEEGIRKSHLMKVFKLYVQKIVKTNERHFTNFQHDNLPLEAERNVQHK